MSKKVLGLLIDVNKTGGHFSGDNEMFGTMISRIGLDNSATSFSIGSIIMNDGMIYESTILIVKYKHKFNGSYDRLFQLVCLINKLINNRIVLQ